MYLSVKLKLTNKYKKNIAPEKLKLNNRYKENIVVYNGYMFL